MYVVSINLKHEKESHFQNKNVNIVNGEEVEKVQQVTLSRIEDNKVYFDRDLPDFLPGRTGSNSVDKSYYKTSKFKESQTFNIIRVYSKDSDGNTIHIYRFTPIGEEIQ